MGGASRRRRLPVGAELDTRNGQVGLTSTGCRGGRQTGTFGGGIFSVRQPRSGCGRVDVHLRGGNFKQCRNVAAGEPRRGRGRSASASRSRRVRKLWGRDQGGKFRSHGRHSHATVRGTRWTTIDRCDGTFTRVTEGAVAVRDLARRRTVLVRAGHSYFAKSRKALRRHAVSTGASALWRRRARRCPWVPLPTVERYDPEAIELKWQQVWADEGTWEVSNEPGEKPMAYVLEMLPYTSGEPHIGHLKNYAVGDAVAHFQRRHGFSVLHPIGYDAFGLPAENHAIKTGLHPRQSTDESIAAFREQFRRWGASFDWTREVSSHEPEYYRWTQWIFLRLYERGLAYRKEAAVKWCPFDQTVLANEQVIDGRCERCGNLVEVRQLEQWFFKITDYADRLLDDMHTIEWPPHVVTMQENWIGRSEGAEVVFRCEELGIDYPVFTTRPDTLFGATFFVLAPEHPDVLRLNDSPGGARLREPRAHRVGRGARVRAQAEDGRARSDGRSRTRPPARRSRCTWPTTCCWSTARGR